MGLIQVPGSWFIVVLLINAIEPIDPIESVGELGIIHKITPIIDLNKHVSFG